MSADVNFCKLEYCSFNHVRMADQSAWLNRRQVKQVSIHPKKKKKVKQVAGKKIKSRARVVQRYKTMLAHNYSKWVLSHVHQAT